MLVPPLWTALVESWQIRPSHQECHVLKTAALQEACYEEPNIPAARHPAKGANAPPIFRPSGQHSE
jgi:hypothetical protein